MQVKEHNISVINSEDLMYKIMSMVNNMILFTCKLLRVHSKYSHHKSNNKINRINYGR